MTDGRQREPSADEPRAASPLDERAKGLLLELARGTLESLFGPEPHALLAAWRAREPELPEALRHESPCFVSLFGRRRRLRGCIGSLVPRGKLYENVHAMTRAAALEDPRFRPVAKAEVAELTIDITVLGPLERLPSLDRLRPEDHGLVVSHRGRRGVLLGDVAVSQEWTNERFLEETCLKAGLDPHRVNEYEISYFSETRIAEPLLTRRRP